MKLLVAALVAAAAACAATEPRSPAGVLGRYASALEAGRLDEAYSLLSQEAKREVSFARFQELVRESPAEVKEIAEALRRASEPAEVTASVTTASGEKLSLAYEGGAWRIDGSPIDLYSQRSPRDAVRSFIRAFENKRYDVLMRFVPEGKLSGLTAGKLKSAWEGEQKREMQELVSALKSVIDAAQIESLARRATVAYGAGGSIELVEEAGIWKIEEF